MPDQPTLAQFRATMLAAGYDEVLERVWAPDTVVDTHTHPFEANAIVVRGEMWLGENGSERRLLPGEAGGVRRKQEITSYAVYDMRLCQNRSLQSGIFVLYF